MNKFSPHKELVHRQFSAHARRYDQLARLQKRVARHLSKSFPKIQRPDILEIGCGTGFLTRHLRATYPDADLHITDLSQAMLDQCRLNIGKQENIHYGLMDGEQPDLTKRHDLIITGMTVQWFDRPERSLEQLRSLLNPGGQLLYSTVGPDLFAQWRAVLDELDLPCGLVDMPDLPGRITQEIYEMQFDTGIDFLESLKSTGASTPRPGYPGLTVVELRRAIRLFERKMQCRADWHILYGQLRG